MAQSFGIDLNAFGDSKISIEELRPLLEKDIHFAPKRDQTDIGLSGPSR